MTLSSFLPMLAMGISVIVAIVGHEVMHGRAAYKYGDETAKIAGRLSFNPLVHVDLVVTILVPILMYMSTGFIFGWAKPVPVYMRTVIRNGGWLGAIHVSLAGIIYNFSLAIIATLLLQVLNEPTSLLEAFFKALLIYTVMINVILGIFNLYPIPP
ncbi:MAG: site-2 protease family protein, partial [Campylobacteraceae bacterium]|nr:site-2 protease family protein [Campylobacteraceae bacterium]